ncbi:GntR family transcriptional regulator [Bailinhaonella thermotolerans]|uniref:GntR family transcriptional regulator n=1 Tax=Bailinhaonella thermotolerans TaxID=1070861 RepID=A0A3A4AT85_9ACTN|nr:GntR family transcriptional regulator [Bailinhaonella thermotolerans]RJL31809.1 GntR family transcriptional regulator [Bailinhaonella thermotolerans]
MGGMDFAPPKYAQVVTAISQRIESGEYAPGDLLPSETQLVREFGVGRTTVVRALQILAMQGWIEREHGRGSFVKGVPARLGERSRTGLGILDQAETEAEILRVEREPLPRHVAALMKVEARTPALVRQRLVRQSGNPIALESLWLPLEVTYGTDLDKADRLRTGVRQHLQAIKQLRFDHIAERLTARHPSTEEQERLGLDANAPVLGLLATVYDAAGEVLAVADICLPGELHELEDVYPVT